MSNKKDLKAYVRYDGNGRVIPGALLLQRFKPKGGGQWHQIGAYECCDPFCLPPVYGEDYIIVDIIEGETGITVVIETNPFTNPILEVAAISCESNPPSRIVTLDVQLIEGNVYGYLIPDSLLSETCGVGFRRVCEATKSGWDIDFGG
jgi:hypothetical protein